MSSLAPAGREACWRLPASQEDHLECSPLPKQVLDHLISGAEGRYKNNQPEGNALYTMISEEPKNAPQERWSASTTHPVREHHLKMSLQPEEINPRWFCCQSSRIFHSPFLSPSPTFHPLRSSGQPTELGMQTQKNLPHIFLLQSPDL